MTRKVWLFVFLMEPCWISTLMFGLLFTEAGVWWDLCWGGPVGPAAEAETDERTRDMCVCVCRSCRQSGPAGEEPQAGATGAGGCGHNQSMTGNSHVFVIRFSSSRIICCFFTEITGVLHFLEKKIDKSVNINIISLNVTYANTTSPPHHIFLPVTISMDVLFNHNHVFPIIIN